MVIGAIATANITAPELTSSSITHQEINRLYFSSGNSTFNTYKNYINDPYFKFMVSVDSTMSKSVIKPKTELGRRLLEYRKAALAKGMKTLSADEINAILNEGRGTSTT